MWSPVTRFRCTKEVSAIFSQQRSCGCLACLDKAASGETYCFFLCVPNKSRSYRLYCVFSRYNTNNWGIPAARVMAVCCSMGKTPSSHALDLMNARLSHGAHASSVSFLMGHDHTRVVFRLPKCIVWCPDCFDLLAQRSDLWQVQVFGAGMEHHETVRAREEEHRQGPHCCLLRRLRGF